jgi:hypothetical protein
LKVVLGLVPQVGERVVERIEREAGRHAEADGLVGCRVVEVDAGAVVAPVPEERDFEGRR